MKVVAVDLEMNQPSTRIIQIGAVCFRPESGELVDTFNHLVNPGEVISKEITILTRIKNEDVNAGLSNDIRKIYDESKIENPFKSRVIDVKGVFQMLANTSGAKMRQKVGLAKACEDMGLGWDAKFGNQHNALADAYNTMRLYMFFAKCLKGAVEIKLGTTI